MPSDIGSLSTCPSGSHKGGWHPQPQFFETKFCIPPLSTSNQHWKPEPLSMVYGWWWVGNLKCHSTLIRKQQFLLQVFPCLLLSFWLDSRVLQKLILTVFATVHSFLWGRQSPRFPYSTIFSCPTPFEHSFAWENTCIMSLKIHKVKAQDLLSQSPLQPVVHLEPLTRLTLLLGNTSKNKTHQGTQRCSGHSGSYA